MLTLEMDGAVRLERAALSILPQLSAFACSIDQHGPGLRLYENGAVRALVEPTEVPGQIATVLLGQGTRPVRALLFDKTPETNWSLDWHQDRTIVVRRRIEVPGFGPWTVKHGLIHVAPPAEIQEGRITMRVDAVPQDNAPLLIAPRSHRLGRIAEPEIGAVVKSCGIVACLAEAGDVWIYATPILHASATSQRPRRRRVLQIDFADQSLPGGLEWLGV